MDKINKIKIKDVTYEIGGGGSATVDSGLSTTSENAVQNKVITSELEKKLDKSNFQTTLNSVVAKYENIGGVHYSYDSSSEIIQLQVEYTGATYTDEVTDKEQLCKIVGYTGDTSIPNADTGLYVIFKSSDLEYLKNTFPNRTFNVNVCNVPDDGYDTHELYSIYQDIGSGKAMRGKQYVMEMGSNMGYSNVNILDWNNTRGEFDVTFESLYAKYSGDTSTMFYAYWGHIRNAFYGYSPSCEINGDGNSHTVYIYSSSKVSYYTMNGERTGFYVKFIERSDFNGNVTIDLQHSMDYLYNSSDFDNIKTDISKNKSQIGYLKRDVVYAEPDIADSAHTFTKTINGETLYTTDKDRRNINVVKSVNGKTGSVNLTATVNGFQVIGNNININGNWNENNPSMYDYINNRPFYQEDPTYGDPVYLFSGTDYSQCYCTNTTLQKDIAEGVLEAPFQDYTCYKEGSKYIIKKTEHISNPPSKYCYWSGTTLTSGSSWESIVVGAMGPDDMRYAQNNFYVRPKTEGAIHKLDNKFIQAKTINGESVLGEGEIDMSSYQTKTEAVKIARMTQAQYDALSTKDNNTLYIITDAQ